MADNGQPQRSPSCLAFLTDGLLLPGQNLAIFAPVFALNIACFGFADHAYSLALQWELRPNDMAAAYLLCAFLGLAARVITSFAAIFAAKNPERRAALPWRSLVLETLRGTVRSSGPVATAVDGYILLTASRAGAAVALHLLQSLIVREDYLTPPLIELLVALRAAHRLLLAYIHAVSSIAVVSSVSESPVRGAIRHAWRLARENATRMALFVAADELVAGTILQWHDDAAERALDYGDCAACVDMVWYAYVLLSGARTTFSLCVAAAFYSECSQSAGVEPAGCWQLLWTRGIEWLRCWISQCSNSLGDILQGRTSIRQVLWTMKTKIRYWGFWMLAIVLGHPLVFSILAGICAWLAIEGIPSMFFQNDLLLYRSSLRATYHGSLRLRERAICPKPKVRQFNPLSPWDRADSKQVHIQQVHTRHLPLFKKKSCMK